MSEDYLDPIIHQPVRTRIFACLASRESVTFSHLKKTLGLSDGNLTTHMKKIIDAGYAVMKKEFVNNRPRTTYRLTRKGRAAFERYLRRLKEALDLLQ
ncbi:MAG: helix-turn-helix domain-containing protein [Nitrospirae bacterium]|nr:helix-turn-helix domain-containing protein [Nitrospirota bacterium]